MGMFYKLCVIYNLQISILMLQKSHTSHQALQIPLASLYQGAIEGQSRLPCPMLPDGFRERSR
jgi:hypothetical protein